jgi:ABC-2 type transport system permease protein
VYSKLIAAAVYTLILVVWMGFLALVVGRWMFGTGDLIVLNSDGLVILNYTDILWRYGLAFAVAYLALMTIATLSIAFSAFADNSIGPIVSTMAVIILFTIIGSLDVSVFDLVKPWLFTTHMASWRSFFNDPVPWVAIQKSVFILLVHNILFVAIAIFKFKRKDITS